MIRAKLLNKRSVRKDQYGSPTPENPILPMQPPQEQDEESAAAAAVKDASGQNHLTMKPNDEKRRRTQVNKELFEVCKQPHDGIPASAIRDILVKNGFNGEAMDGIYTGRDGKMHEQCGPRTWIVLNWHKLENTGRYEIVAYVS